MNFFFLFSLPAADYCPTDQSQENRNLWPLCQGRRVPEIGKIYT